MKRRRTAVVISFVLALTTVCLATAAAQPAESSVAFTEIVLPANAEKMEGGLGAISCPREGRCVAVGGYKDGPQIDSTALMAVQQRGRAWDRAVELTPPSNVEQGWNPEISDIACRRPGNCVAVGSYRARGNVERAMVITEKGGKWRRARQMRALPPNAYRPAPRMALTSVACPPNGPCVAVGRYATPHLLSLPMAVTAVAARRPLATRVRLPADAGELVDGELTAVDCPAPAPCVAVGGYSRDTEEAMVVQQKVRHGGWNRAVGLNAAPGAPATGRGQHSARLHDVACWAPGSCVAVGEFGLPTESKQPVYQPLTVSERHGSWGREREVAPPATSTSPSGFSLASVACRSSGACVAVGNTGAYPAAMLVKGRYGSWETATEPTIAPSLNAVAVSPTGPFVAVTGLMVAEFGG
jgi:hypothetical protein